MDDGSRWARSAFRRYREIAIAGVLFAGLVFAVVFAAARLLPGSHGFDSWQRPPGFVRIDAYKDCGSKYCADVFVFGSNESSTAEAIDRVAKEFESRHWSAVRPDVTNERNGFVLHTDSPSGEDCLTYSDANRKEVFPHSGLAAKLANYKAAIEVVFITGICGG